MWVGYVDGKNVFDLLPISLEIRRNGMFDDANGPSWFLALQWRHMAAECWQLDANAHNRICLTQSWAVLCSGIPHVCQRMGQQSLNVHPRSDQEACMIVSKSVMLPSCTCRHSYTMHFWGLCLCFDEIFAASDAHSKWKVVHLTMQIVQEEKLTKQATTKRKSKRSYCNFICRINLRWNCCIGTAGIQSVTVVLWIRPSADFRPKGRLWIHTDPHNAANAPFCQICWNSLCRFMAW